MDDVATFVERPLALGAVTIRLPVPPSVNAAYANAPGRGRVKTAAYKAWLISADILYLTQKRTTGRLKGLGTYSADIAIPATTKGDADGRIKLILDWLVSRDITDDDRMCWDVRCHRDSNLSDFCQVTVQTVELA